MIIFEYDEQGPGPGLTIMTTYVPNNGNKVGATKTSCQPACISMPTRLHLLVGMATYVPNSGGSREEMSRNPAAFLCSELSSPPPVLHTHVVFQCHPVRPKAKRLLERQGWDRDITVRQPCAMAV